MSQFFLQTLSRFIFYNQIAVHRPFLPYFTLISKEIGQNHLYPSRHGLG